MHYYEVAPRKIIRAGTDFLTYQSAEPLNIGQIVTIPVGRQQLVGVVWRKATKPDFAIKDITSVIATTPIPQPLLTTLTWISQYYDTPVATVLQTALPRGVEKTRRIKDTATHIDSKIPLRTDFTVDQARAIKTLDSSPSGTTLLHGVTGSGKTAVYIDQAAKAIAAQKSVIILVPEIALTSQLVEQFAQHFDDVIVAHSRQTEAERHILWQTALDSTKPKIIIGPRSALFIPLASIGLIVVDEMHEPSFKQEQSPRYSALRVAGILGHEHVAKIILGSATPPIAEYYLASKTDQQIIAMTHPARPDTVKPHIELVDLTKRQNFSRHRFISNTLFTQIETTLAASKQALIFHNRRGSAPTTLCENCGWQAGCPRCFVPLTLHADQHTLRCHICGFSDRVPTSCPVCHEPSIIHKGIGTKLIETELKKLFSKATIARFDGDSDAEDTVDKRYSELKNGDIDIIIGTQVIAKGLDLPNLRTVGVIQADAGLSLPDFASPERTFQLLAQVVGRVGRSHHETNVIVQSFQPTHPAVQLGIAQNYHDFYEHTLNLRKRANFPPFCFLLKLTCTYKTEKTAIKNAMQLVQTLRQKAPSSIEILGPTPAFYERQRDTYRWQLTLKSRKRSDLIKALEFLPPTHWQFELDPTSLL